MVKVPHHWMLASLAGAMLVLASCDDGPAPAEVEVEMELYKGLGPQYRLEIDDMEPHIDSETAQGRVSVSGSLVANSDLYVPLTPHEAEQELLKRGIPIDHLAYIRSFEPAPMYIRQIVTREDTIPFNLELAARQGTNSWDLRAERNPIEAAGIQILGESRDKFPVNTEILADGDPSPHLAKLLAISKEITAADAKASKSFESVIAGGKPVRLRFWQKENPARAVYNREPFTLTFTATKPIATEPGNGQFGEQITLEGSVVMKGPPSDFSGSYNRGNGKFTPVSKVRLIGSLTRFDPPKSIKSAYNLTIKFQSGPSNEYYPFQSSEAYFSEGKITTYDLDTYYGWRWAQ